MLTCSVVVSSFAQGESLSKQINQIKRDTATYLWSEATDETAEKALDAARTMLMVQVQEYLDSNHYTSKVNDADRQSVYAKTSSLEMMRGSRYRDFVYVKKSDVNAIFGIRQQPTEETDTPQSPSSDPVANMVDDVTDNRNAEKEKERNKQPASEPATEKAPSGDQKTVSDPGLPEWQMNSIDDLLKCRDINEARARLNRLKVEYRVQKFGVPDNCPSPENAFWIIFSQDGRVNTVLGPGTKERVSFRDMTTTELDNYKGMNALWFNFAN